MEISNINFTKVYNYKIIVTDNYGYSDTILDGKVPTGQSIWTEYKDRVDFLQLTVGGYNPFEYNEAEEIIVGVYDDGVNQKPIYRRVFTGTSPNARTINIDLAQMSVDKLIKADGLVKSVYNNWWPIQNHYLFDSNYDTSTVLNAVNELVVDLGTYYSYPDYRIIVEYTKT